MIKDSLTKILETKAEIKTALASNNIYAKGYFKYYPEMISALNFIDKEMFDMFFELVENEYFVEVTEEATIYYLKYKYRFSPEEDIFVMGPEDHRKENTLGDVFKDFTKGKYLSGVHSNGGPTQPYYITREDAMCIYFNLNGTNLMSKRGLHIHGKLLNISSIYDVHEFDYLDGTDTKTKISNPTDEISDYYITLKNNTRYLMVNLSLDDSDKSYIEIYDL